MIWIFAGIGLLAFVLFMIIRAAGIRKRARIEQERAAAELIAAQQAAASQLPVETKNEIYSILERFAKKNPEDVAKVLKSWINED